MLLSYICVSLENLIRMNANDQSNWPTNRFGRIERHWDDRTATITNTRSYAKPRPWARFHRARVEGTSGLGVG
jgi:hypothetical protein